MSNKIFENVRKSELKSANSNFNFDEILYKTVNNSYWQDKKALWTVISGACNDAAREYFTEMQDFLYAIADIDTCNIHTLKSIAKSVNAEHITDFIEENYPKDLLKLINLFSIPKHLLINPAVGVLHVESTLELFGSIDQRNLLLKPKKYQYSLFYQIKEELNNLYYMFLTNKIPITKNLLDYGEEFYLSTLFKSSAILNSVQTLIYNEIPSDCKLFNTIISDETSKLSFVSISNFDNLSLYHILDMIKNYFVYNNELINTCLESKTIVKFDGVYWLNPFHILISLIKMFTWVPFTENNLNCIILNQELNTYVNLYPLCFKMLETIQYYDDMYLDKFVHYHFYGLFYDKIINLDLINEWTWDNITYSKYFISAFSEYTFDELYNIVKDNITLDDLISMTNEMTVFNRRHVDFIQYLSILNNSLNSQENETDQIHKTFKFDITKLNNIFNINDTYNDELRRLLGISFDKDGNRLPVSNDLLSELASKFTDLCIRILYAREELKTIVQQYALIGTNKIVTDVIRDHFLKNYTDKNVWRLKNSESTGKIKLPTVNELNSQNTLTPLSVNIVEYYDNTNYFNIKTDLPSCLLGNNLIGYHFEERQRITSADTTVTSLVENFPGCQVVRMLDENGDILKGVVSTIYDNYNFQIPPELYPSEKTVDITIDNIVFGSYPVWQAPVTSLLIPEGTIVSSVVPAGTVETYTETIPDYEDVVGLCATFVTEYNNKFWERNFEFEQKNPSELLEEISFYENFFTELKQYTTQESKISYYINNVYPLLSASWENFATSGFMNNSYLYPLQEKYSGQLPGKYLTQNHANKTFTTIATLPYIPNLTPVTYISDETLLYLSKPFYENVAYYILLMTNEILRYV